MSYITEVLVVGPRGNQIDPLNDWLREADTDRHQQFREINMDSAGGTKYFTSPVWAAAFNYVPHELMDKLRDPETWGNQVLLVSVVVHGEEINEAFTFEQVEGVYQPVTKQEWRQ